MNQEMNPFAILAIIYGITLFCLFVFHLIADWKDIHTIGDLILPEIFDNRYNSFYVLYVPIVNSIFLVMLLVMVIVTGIKDFFTKLFNEWTHISENFSKFLDIKIKK